MNQSKEYSWAWVTSSQVVSHAPCELVLVTLVASSATNDSTIYDGTTDKGKIILKLVTASANTKTIKFTVPIYCPDGLYVAVGTSVTGILVMWRSLPKE